MFSRRVGAGLVASAALVVAFSAGAAAPAASAVSASASASASAASYDRPTTSVEQPQNPGEYTWSDCIYDTGLGDATFIEQFAGGVVLTCAGVRHIKSGHGFDNDTEGCIYNTLNHVYSKAPSNSDPNNWVYLAYWSAGGNEAMQYYKSFVVTDRVSNNIVTAYTDTNTIAGDDSWYTCARIAF